MVVTPFWIQRVPAGSKEVPQRVAPGRLEPPPALRDQLTGGTVREPGPPVK